MRLTSAAPGATTSTARKRVLDLVRAHPGSTIQDIAKACDFSHANASYHLSNLCRLHLLVAVREGRMLRHYLPGTDPARARPTVWADDPRRSQLLEVLRKNPHKSWSINQLAVELGVSHGFLTRSLQVLVREQYVRIERMRWISYVRVVPRAMATQDLESSKAEKPEDRGGPEGAARAAPNEALAVAVPAFPMFRSSPMGPS